MGIEAPQSFIVREECEKAASHNGFRRVQGEEAGWRAFTSTTAHGAIYLAAESSHGPWFLATDHIGVVAELDLPTADIPGPGTLRYTFSSLGELYSALSRVYALAISLPDAPLREFQRRVAELPRTTEVERLVVQRIGQDIFRNRLMDYWQERCPLTEITDPALLRASHIIPWKACASDQERLDVHNGLLLSSLWDAAFDGGLVTFDDEGCPVFSPVLSEQARRGLFCGTPLRLTAHHRRRLDYHRSTVFIASSL